MSTTNIYTLSLHDALPIYHVAQVPVRRRDHADVHAPGDVIGTDLLQLTGLEKPQQQALHPQRHLSDFVQEHGSRSEEHTSELQSLRHLVCRLLLEKKKNTQ